MKPDTGELPNVDASDAAIARVLQAERGARESIAATTLEVERQAEASRRAAASLAERTERRARAVVAAFQARVARELAEIEQDGGATPPAQALGAAETELLRQAVRALARELVEGPP